MSTFQTKAITGFEIKSADRGEVTAVVSTLNVVDREGDVILSGAVADGSVVKISAYDHDVILKELPPVGLGRLSIRGDQVIMEGTYFLKTARGLDAFETVKGLGPHSDWSIGFEKAVKTAPLTDSWRAKGARRVIASMRILETSPVTTGANPLTGTLAAKAAQAAVEAVDSAENNFLRDLWNRHVLPLELRAYRDHAEEMLEQSDIRQLALRNHDRELTRPDSYAAPEFDKVTAFARAQLGLNFRALPMPRLVRPGTLKSAEGELARGIFLVAKGAPRIYLEDTGDFARMARTFFHEAAHCRQHHFGDPMTEPDACQQADTLFAAWQSRS